MIDFPITENQIRVLSDEKLREVLELCHTEHDRRQKNYFEIAQQKIKVDKWKQKQKTKR